jgi:hypothetical protein
VEWKQWSYRMARTVFRVFCGRTEIDSRHEYECGEADPCTDRVIGHCRLFYQLRYVKEYSRLTVVFLFRCFYFYVLHLLFIDKNLYTFWLTNCHFLLAELLSDVLVTGLLHA